MPVVKIGKATLVVTAQQCVDCGTRWSSGWETAKVIRVQVEGVLKPIEVNLHRCDDCAKRRRN